MLQGKSERDPRWKNNRNYRIVPVPGRPGGGALHRQRRGTGNRKFKCFRSTVAFPKWTSARLWGKAGSAPLNALVLADPLSQIPRFPDLLTNSSGPVRRLANYLPISRNNLRTSPARLPGPAHYSYSRSLLTVSAPTYLTRTRAARITGADSQPGPLIIWPGLVLEGRQITQ